MTRGAHNGLSYALGFEESISLRAIRIHPTRAQLPVVRRGEHIAAGKKTMVIYVPYTRARSKRVHRR